MRAVPTEAGEASKRSRDLWAQSQAYLLLHPEVELLLYNIFETSCSDEEGALLVVTSVAHCNLRLSYERMRGMLDVYGAAAQLCRGAQLLRCCAASLRPPAGRVSIRSRIGDRPPVGRVSIRSRIGDKHPAGRGSALRASRKVMPILSSMPPLVFPLG